MIARIWGSAFGVPHPSLMPTKSEWQARRELVTEAVDRLRRRGVEATGKVVSAGMPPGESSPKPGAPAREPSSWRRPLRVTGSSPIFSGNKSLIGYAASPARVYLIVEGQSAMLDKPPSAAAGGADRLAFARQLSQKQARDVLRIAGPEVLPSTNSKGETMASAVRIAPIANRRCGDRSQSPVSPKPACKGPPFLARTGGRGPLSKPQTPPMTPIFKKNRRIEYFACCFLSRCLISFKETLCGRRSSHVRHSGVVP